MLLFPWWVYLCIVGIIFSAYKLMTTAKEEEKDRSGFYRKRRPHLYRTDGKRKSTAHEAFIG
nr:sporulation YhaL family protein [Bacillus paralicheniformis]MDI0245892.1 sporulation YhaL family protein [Bacillus paralicheniformis]